MKWLSAKWGNPVTAVLFSLLPSLLLHQSSVRVRSGIQKELKKKKRKVVLQIFLFLPSTLLHASFLLFFFISSRLLTLGRLEVRGWRNQAIVTWFSLLRCWLVCGVWSLAFDDSAFHKQMMQWFAHRWIKRHTCLRSLDTEVNCLNVHSDNSTHCLPAAQATNWIHACGYVKFKNVITPFLCVCLCLHQSVLSVCIRVST